MAVHQRLGRCWRQWSQSPNLAHRIDEVASPRRPGDRSFGFRESSRTRACPNQQRAHVGTRPARCPDRAPQPRRTVQSISMDYGSRICRFLRRGSLDQALPRHSAEVCFGSTIRGDASTTFEFRRVRIKRRYRKNVSEILLSRPEHLSGGADGDRRRAHANERYSRRIKCRVGLSQVTSHVHFGDYTVVALRGRVDCSPRFAGIPDPTPAKPELID